MNDTTNRHGHTDVQRLRLARAFDSAAASGVGITLGVWAGRGDWAHCSQGHRDKEGHRALAELDDLIDRLTAFRDELNAELAVTGEIDAGPAAQRDGSHR